MDLSLVAGQQTDSDLHESLLDLNKRLSSDLNWALKQLRKYKSSHKATHKTDAASTSENATLKADAKKKSQGIREVNGITLLGVNTEHESFSHVSLTPSFSITQVVHFLHHAPS